MFLPDINLWLALVFESHFHHRAARAWFDAVTDDSCFFCRLTQQGFLRLPTNPHVFPEEAAAEGSVDSVRHDAQRFPCGVRPGTGTDSRTLAEALGMSDDEARFQRYALWVGKSDALDLIIEARAAGMRLEKLDAPALSA